MGDKDPSGSRQRWILHVDMDAFFASVEALDDPGLRGKPLIVGGTGRRGVVASCSYEARAFGIRSAMPSAVARRLCPWAVFVPGRYDRYSEISRQMHQIFQRYTPLVEGISIDEAFLDVSGAIALLGPAPSIASDIRRAVREELGLGCSVGAAPVKFLAKLASEAAKPQVAPAAAGLSGMRPDVASLAAASADPGQRGSGVYVIRPGQELAFLHPLPIEALWGVGPASATRLRRLGLQTIGDLARIPTETLTAAVGKAHGLHLAALARGIDERSVEPVRETKSVSHEETYATDRYDPGELHIELVRMSDSVATRMRAAALIGRTVTIKVRYGDFTTYTRSVTSKSMLDSGPEIARLASDLLEKVDLEPGVRLLGVGVSNLAPARSAPAEQLALDLSGAAPGRPARAAPTAAIDAIRERFGVGAVGPAALLEGGGLRLKRTGDTQWGPTRKPPPER